MNNIQINDKHKKTALILAILILILMVGFLVYDNISKIGKTKIYIQVAPAKTQFEIDGQKFTGDKTIYIKPGKYQLTGKAENFKEDNQEIEVTKDSSNFFIQLDAANEAGEKEASNDWATYESLAGQRVDKESKKMSDRNPVTKWLPIKKMLYTIGFTMNDPDDEYNVIVTIHANKGYRNTAIEGLADHYQDLANLKIKIVDYVNPFEEK